MSHTIRHRALLCVLVVSFLFLSCLCVGDVTVRAGKLVVGGAGSVLVPPHGFCTFETILENPDERSHLVMFRLSPSQQNANNPQVEIPGKTQMKFQAPVYLNKAETYTFEVFQDGQRLPSSVQNQIKITLPDARGETIGMFHDVETSESAKYGSSLSGFKKNTMFPHPLAQVRYTWRDVPTHWKFFDSLRMLVVCNPDFSHYSSAQFSAIMEYVAQGGVLVFAHPLGALKAAETPLAELMPVCPIGIRQISHLEGLDTLLGPCGFKGLMNPIYFLDSVESSVTEGVTFATHEGFPLLRECRYGLGTVRFLAISPNRSNFTGNNEVSDRLMARVLAMPHRLPTYQAMRKPLDDLTGFSVPGVGVVQLLLGGYFVFLLIAFCLFRKGRLGRWSWGLCVLVALLWTLGILAYANRTFGGRGALTAEVLVENAAVPGSGESYVSLYVPSATKQTIGARGNRTMMCAVPHRTVLLKDRFKASGDSLSPLDLRTCADGSMELHDITLSARTSRHFVEYVSPLFQHSRSGVSWQSPRLVLGQDGLRLEPWTLPEGESHDHVFLVFPNGSRLVKVSETGACSLGEESMMLTDPLLSDLRDGLERSYTKLHPALVVVSSFEAAERGTLSCPSRQGKRLRLYPVSLVAESRSVELPSELLVLSHGQSPTLGMLDGNRLTKNKEFSFLGNSNANVKFWLPTSLAGFRAHSARLRLRITNSEQIEPIPRFVDRKGRELRGRLVKPGEYVFEGLDRFGPFQPENLNATLIIEGRLRPEATSEQDFSSNNWAVLDLDLSFRGTLPESVLNKSL